jgi:hypothetical protein
MKRVEIPDMGIRRDIWFENCNKKKIGFRAVNDPAETKIDT